MLAFKALENGNYRTSLRKIDQARLWPHNLGAGKPYDNMIDDSVETRLRAAVLKASGKKSFVDEIMSEWNNSRTEPAGRLTADEFYDTAKIKEAIEAITAKADQRLFD